MATATESRQCHVCNDGYYRVNTLGFWLDETRKVWLKLCCTCLPYARAIQVITFVKNPARRRLSRAA